MVNFTFAGNGAAQVFLYLVFFWKDLCKSLIVKDFTIPILKSDQDRARNLISAKKAYSTVESLFNRVGILEIFLGHFPKWFWLKYRLRIFIEILDDDCRVFICCVYYLLLLVELHPTILIQSKPILYVYLRSWASRLQLILIPHRRCILHLRHPLMQATPTTSIHMILRQQLLRRAGL